MTGEVLPTANGSKPKVLKPVERVIDIGTSLEKQAEYGVPEDLQHEPQKGLSVKIRITGGDPVYLELGPDFKSLIWATEFDDNTFGLSAEPILESFGYRYEATYPGPGTCVYELAKDDEPKLSLSLIWQRNPKNPKLMEGALVGKDLPVEPLEALFRETGAGATNTSATELSRVVAGYLL